MNAMAAAAVETGHFVIDEARLAAPDGTLYRVRNLGRRRVGGVVSRPYLEVAASRDRGASWHVLPLRPFVLHRLRAHACNWPPPAALASRVIGGAVAIEFDSVFDPWEKAPAPRLLAHARWLAVWRPNLRSWTLRQLHVHDPDTAAPTR
jgi:hypothetical protein